MFTDDVSGLKPYCENDDMYKHAAHNYLNKFFLHLISLHRLLRKPLSHPQQVPPTD